MKGRPVLLLFALFAAAALGADGETDLFDKAEKHFRERKYDLALEGYDAFLRSRPASELAADAEFRRAAALYFLGRHREAADLFRRIELRYRSTRFLGSVPFWKGLASFRMKDYEGSAREFSAFLAEGAEGEAAEQSLLYLCLSRNALGRAAEAGSAFAALAEKADPRRMTGYAAFLVSSLSGKNPAEEKELHLPAAGVLRAALPAAGPDDVFRIRLVLGEAEIRRGRHEAAEDLLRPAAAAENSSRDGYPRAVYLLAYALFQNGKPAEAAAAVDLALAPDGGKEFGPPLLRLRSFAAERLGDAGLALEASLDYLAAVPDDVSVRFDIARHLAALRDYRRLAETAAGILKDSPDLAVRDPRRHALLRYLQGTAELNLGGYGSAADILTRLLRTGEALPPETLSSARFFAAWALYRGARYAEALPVFLESAAEKPESGYFFRASYYGAWCAFSLGRFSEAAALLEKAVFRTGTDGGPVLQRRGIFLLGKTYAARGRTAEAAREYRRLFTEYPASEIAAEARFEYAGVAAAAGDTDGAAAAFKAIPGLYPASPLGESALMRRGEILYAAGRWTDARSAFYDYRAAFPAGRYVDQALYWGALAAAKAGERHGALLLWENLAERFPGSPLRPVSLRETAEMYARLGDYPRAAEKYREILSRHPAEASSFGAEKRLEELRLLAGGAAEREAALLVRIRGAGGPASPEGRQALLDLAVFYAGEGPPDSEKARPLLEDLRRRAAEDPKRAAEAGYLLGELSRRSRKYGEAASHYLAAASETGADRDLVARSLLRAAETMLLAGRPDEAARLAESLKRNFPGTDWAAEGEKILGGRK